MNLDDIALIVCAFALLFLTIGKSHAGQSICNQFDNNRIVCQNYDDNGVYENQSYMQRNGDSNTFSTTEDQQ